MRWLSRAPEAYAEPAADLGESRIGIEIGQIADEVSAGKRR